MKTNINNIIMDTVDEIKELLSDIDTRLDCIEGRLNELEISQPCDCLVDVDMNKINNLILGNSEIIVGKEMNKIKCLECNTELESKYRWDFQSCGCDNHAFVDGGNAYRRIGYKDINKILVWNETKQKFVKVTTE